MGNRRAHAGADGAGRGPGGLMDRAGSVGRGHCGRWLETIHRGSSKRCDADREAGRDLWVHTAQTAASDEEEKTGENEILCQSDGQDDL